MNKKFCLIVIITCLLPTYVSAYNPEISITSTSNLDRLGNGLFSVNNTGDQLTVNFSVYDKDGWNDISKVYLAWGEYSWLDCLRLYVNQSSNIIDYTCILTVTPSMQNQTNVYLIAWSRVGNESSNYTKSFVGNYNFSSRDFLEYLPMTVTDRPITIILPKSNLSIPNQCPIKQVCTSYKKSCTIICVRKKLN